MTRSKKFISVRSTKKLLKFIWLSFIGIAVLGGIIWTTQSKPKLKTAQAQSSTITLGIVPSNQPIAATLNTPVAVTLSFTAPSGHSISAGDIVFQNSANLRIIAIEHVPTLASTNEKSNKSDSQARYLFTSLESLQQTHTIKVTLMPVQGGNGTLALNTQSTKIVGTISAPPYTFALPVISPIQIAITSNSISPQPSTTPLKQPSLTPASVPNQRFSDVPTTHTFYNVIENLARDGIVGGYPDGTFKPSNPVTRGEMSKFIYTAFGLSTDISCGNFTDIKPDNPFYTVITTMKCKGIVGGRKDGSFGAAMYVTRAEAMKFIVNGLRAKKNDPSYLQYTGNEKRFSDVQVANPFYPYIMGASDPSVRIISGYSDGSFRPYITISRAEMSKIIDFARKK